VRNPEMLCFVLQQEQQRSEEYAGFFYGSSRESSDREAASGITCRARIRTAMCQRSSTNRTEIQIPIPPSSPSGVGDMVLAVRVSGRDGPGLLAFEGSHIQ
jgi:hypothetical protein